MPPLPPARLAPRCATLDNGVTVLLDPFDEAPRVAWRVVARVGAAHDPPGASGAAHLLEHMLANKGTRHLGTRDWAAEAPLLDEIRALTAQVAAASGPQRARLAARLDALERAAWAHVLPNELKRAAGRLGARGLNAATSHDRTWYRVDLPPHRLAQWAALDADRFSGPVVRAFATELQTVCEEKRRALDHPGRALSRAMGRAVWGEHPYGRPILGTPADLERAHVGALEAVLSAGYQPANLAVCLSGPFEPEATLALLAETFGRIPAGEAPLPASPPAPGPFAPSRVEVVHQEDLEVRLVWRTVPRSHPDRAALTLAGDLLGDSALGLLARDLRFPKRVRGASSFRYAMRWGGLLAVRGVPREGQGLDTLEGLLHGVVARLVRGDVDPDDLVALQRNRVMREERALEAAEHRAAALARSFTHGEDWPEAGRFLERLAAVTLDEVVAAAGRHLGGPPAVLVRRRGAPPAVSLAPPPTSERPAPAPGQSAFLAEVLARPVAPPPLQQVQAGVDYQDEVQPWGRLLRNTNPCNDLFALHLAWDHGTHRRRGLGAAFGLWGLSGAGGLDRAGLERALSHAGVGLRWSVGQHRLTVRVGGRGAALQPALRLLVDRLRAPALDPAHRDAHIDDVLQRRQDRKSTQDGKLDALQQWALYGEDSAHRGRALGEAELRALAQTALADWTAPLLGWRPVALYTGNHDPAALRRALGAWGEDRSPLPPPPARAYAPQTADRVLLVHHEAAQAQVCVLQPVAPERPGEGDLRLLLNRAWGGSAGVFFQEVREARGWAYSVQGQLSRGVRAGEPGLRWCRAATRPGQAAACAALLVELLRHRPLSEDRLSRARHDAEEALRASHVGFRSVPSTALAWEEAGYRSDPRGPRLEALRARSAADLEAYRAGQAARPLTVAILGDLTQLDRPALAALGAVSELGSADLFAY